VSAHQPRGRLLADDEPDAFDVVNAGGAAPLVLVCDHASNRIPRALHHLGLPPAPLRDHIAWDIGAAEVARRLSRRFDAPLALAGYSRLVIDCNRPLGHATSIPAESDGVPVPGNRGLSQGERLQRADALFHPYHAAVAKLVDRLKAGTDAAAFVSVHSFTPVFQRERRPWHIGVLWNRDFRLAGPLLAELRRHGDIVVGDNQPYSGRDAASYSIVEHAAKRDLLHVAVEIRQDLIAVASGAEHWAAVLGDALRDALPAAGIRPALPGHAP
jgi:predicted N-formylglutamate amidohydrolase